MYLRCPGCLQRGRVNAACEWRHDPAVPLDLARSLDRKHLVYDAQLAEDLAIRYADAEYRRRSGYDGHGGLIGDGNFRSRCMARLVDAIERNHAVTPDDIRVARGQRNATFDVGVAVLFLPLYFAIGAWCWIAIRRRFSSDSPAVVVAATGVASLAVSFMGVQLLELWLGVWESIRVGNGHISVFRAATWNRWNQTHHGLEFAAGAALFLFVSALVQRLPRMYNHAP